MQLQASLVYSPFNTGYPMTKCNQTCAYKMPDWLYPSCLNCTPKAACFTQGMQCMCVGHCFRNLLCLNWEMCVAQIEFEVEVCRRWEADRGDMSTRAMWATSGQLSSGQQTTLSGWHVNLDDGRQTFKRIPHTSSQHNLGLMPQIIIKGNGISHELIVFGKVSMMASEDFKTKRRFPVAFLWSVPKGNMCWNSFEQILIFGRLRLE